MIRSCDCEIVNAYFMVGHLWLHFGKCSFITDAHLTLIMSSIMSQPITMNVLQKWGKTQNLELTLVSKEISRMLAYPNLN